MLSSQDKAVPLHDIIILGSGIAGLSAANAAKKDGKSVLVIDKGQRLGGRVTTRKKNGFNFNHGAQFVTSNGPNFRELLSRASRIGCLNDWNITPSKTVQIGMPTMLALPKFMARGIELLQRVEITSILHIGPYIGFLNDTGLIACGRHAIVSAPAAQSAHLLAKIYPELSATANQATYDPCWTIMLGLEKEITHEEGILQKPFPLRDEPAGIAFAVPETLRIGDFKNLKKPPAPALTIQATGWWSQMHLHNDANTVIRLLCATWTRISSQTIPPILEATAHRWRYAKVTRTADGSAPRRSADGKLAIAGDWLVGPRVEEAFDSGLAAYLTLS